MREFKFRAWHKDLKIMSTNVFNINNPDSFKAPLFEVEEPSVAVADGIIWMQYTGLLDKNGKEIYEGDIVSFFSLLNNNKLPEDEDIGEIVFGCTAFWIRGIAMSSFMPEQITIIGNIYENPQLLNYYQNKEERNAKKTKRC